MLADGDLKFDRTGARAVFVIFVFFSSIFFLSYVAPVQLYAHQYAHKAVGACMQQVVLRLDDCSPAASLHQAVGACIQQSAQGAVKQQ